jgi:hypothetical protein
MRQNRSWHRCSPACTACAASAYPQLGGLALGGGEALLHGGDLCRSLAPQLLLRTTRGRRAGVPADRSGAGPAPATKWRLRTSFALRAACFAARPPARAQHRGPAQEQRRQSATRRGCARCVPAAPTLACLPASCRASVRSDCNWRIMLRSCFCVAHLRERGGARRAARARVRAARLHLLFRARRRSCALERGRQSRVPLVQRRHLALRASATRHATHWRQRARLKQFDVVTARRVLQLFVILPALRQRRLQRRHLRPSVADQSTRAAPRAYLLSEGGARGALVAQHAEKGRDIPVTRLARLEGDHAAQLLVGLADLLFEPRDLQCVWRRRVVSTGRRYNQLAASGQAKLLGRAERRAVRSSLCRA